MAALIQVSRVSIDHAMMTSVPLDALEELLVLEGMHAHSKFHRQFFRLWTPHVKYSSDVCSEGCNYTFPYAKHSHSTFHRGLCFPLAWILEVPLSFNSTFNIIHVFLQFIIHTVAMYHETKRDGYAALIISKCLLVHLADVRIYL